MSLSSAAELLRELFPHQPTESQERLFGYLQEFITDSQSERRVFILQGYAGTGKTTIVATLVKVFKSLGYKTLMMAPTGRASKVMSLYSGQMAFTIHKIIFKPQQDLQGIIRFIRQKNTYKNTVFIVDEASMIGNDCEFDRKGLLDELIEFVFENQQAANKLMFIGDTAQLPPVGMVKSPALTLSVLRDRHKCTTTGFQLREVVRQSQTSGILHNATMLRDKLTQGQTDFALRTRGFADVMSIHGNELSEWLETCYHTFGEENTVVICRTNKETIRVNDFIRRHLLQRELELDVGDMLMIVKNNYFWLPVESPAGFLANGEFVQVLRINNIEEKYGMRFADLTLRLVDYPEAGDFEAKVHLSTLTDPSAALSATHIQALVKAVCDSERINYEEAQMNPYCQALQVKFAYALTCHKAQGGQWNAIFVIMGFLTQEMINEELLRWLYTALTRAKDRVFLVNFRPEFLEV